MSDARVGRWTQATCGLRSVVHLASAHLAWLALVGLFATPLLAQDDEEDAPTGLVATYYAAGDTEPLFTRSEAAPALRLTAGTSPDPRLAETGWKVRWTGVLRVLRPGKYKFWIETNGPASVSLNNAPVVKATEIESDLPSGEVELKFGAHPIVVDFMAARTAPVFRIYWQGENFAREPLSALSLEHAEKDEFHSDGYALGQLAVEEHSCVACHSPAASKIARSLAQRPGPKLSSAGTRLRAGWIYRWLGDPHAIRPEAVMPKSFGDDRKSDVERYAVAAYLAGLGSIPEAAPDDAARQKSLQERGKAHFAQIGCVVCHEPQQGKAPVASLRWLGEKTTIPALEKFVKNPSSFDPAGRMPNFALTDAQIRELSAFLVTYNSPGTPAEKPDFELPPAPQSRELRDLALGLHPSVEQASEFTSKPLEQQLAAVAIKAIESRRCVNCHELKPAGSPVQFKPTPAAANYAAIAKKPEGGCLAADASPSSPAPRFGASLARGAAVEFLKASAAGPETVSPAQTASLNLQRLNCLGCHARNGKDGLSPELTAQFLENQTQAAAEAVKPPVLTGVAGKLTATALKDVLEEGKRSRPWMSLQMPTFRKEHLATIPAGVAALDGDTLAVAVEAKPADKSLIEAGRTLVGTKGFGCVKCHDMLGIPSGGTRGPDLSLVGDRIRRDWYHRWMTDPQRIEPGTRMPTVFLNNASPYPKILGGDPPQQIEAIWAYLLASKNLPPPEGMTPTAPTGVEAPANIDAPQLVRSFLPNLAPRGVAIRFPNGVHLAFDAQSCRVGYAWSGDFLDMGPVWNGRGGQVAGLKGPVFWAAPGGFPWDVTDSPGSVPNFTGRDKDTLYGATVPHVVPNEGRSYPVRVHFKGYGTVGAPTFRYSFDLDGGGEAKFSESLVSLDTPAAKGLLREATIEAPAGRTLWLLAAESEQPIVWKKGDQSGKLTANAESPPAGAVLTVVQGGKPLVLHVRKSSPEAEWAIAEQNGKLSVFVRVPATTGETKLSLAVLRPNESDAGTTVEDEAGK